MDLLTRGAASATSARRSSLIYASFTFIFFALEAAIMAYALDLAFDIPPAWGYLLCAVVVIPLVTHGVTAISRLQAWTCPVAGDAGALRLRVQRAPGILGLAAYGGEHGARFASTPSARR
jgi:hypothetical protein